MKKLSYFLTAMLLTGCSREFVESIYDVNYEPTNRFVSNLAELPGQFEKDTGALDSLINSFSGNIQKRWGSSEVKMAGKSNYVKYIDTCLLISWPCYICGIFSLGVWRGQNTIYILAYILEYNQINRYGQTSSKCQDQYIGSHQRGS